MPRPNVSMMRVATAIGRKLYTIQAQYTNAIVTCEIKIFQPLEEF